MKIVTKLIIIGFGVLLSGCVINGQGREVQISDEISELLERSVKDILSIYASTDSVCLVVKLFPEGFQREVLENRLGRCIIEEGEMLVKDGRFINNNTGDNVAVLGAQILKRGESEVVVEVFGAIAPMGGNSYIYTYKRKSGKWNLISRELGMLA